MQSDKQKPTSEFKREPLSMLKLILIISFIVLSVILIGLAIYKLTNPGTPLLAPKVTTSPEKQKVKNIALQDLFPKDTQIIEERNITNIDNRKIVLWMINPEKFPKTDDLYTCPEITRGSYYKGLTKVSLVDSDKMKIINTTEIASLYSDIKELDIPYQIKDDAGPYFVRENPEEKEGVPVIIKLKDYNQDGKELEFALFESPACISPSMTMIGYSEKQDKIIQYDFNLQEKEKDKISSKSKKWISTIYLKERNSTNYWEAQSDTCGRGGNIAKSKISYNKEKEVFEGEMEIIDCESNDETADWKTYRNEEYGFEFKYPLNFNLGEYIPQLGQERDWDGIGIEYAMVIDLSDNNDSGPIVNPSLRLSVTSVLYNNVLEKYEKHGITNKNTENNIEVGNIKGIKKNNIIFLPTKKYTFIIRSYTGSLPVFNQILSTFKFIESIDTKDWQIYSNPEVDFTFKYPKDWKISQDYFYEPLGGHKATKRTVVLREIGNEEEFIAINLRQFSCDQGGTCKDVLGNLIGTFSSNPETLNVFNQILSTFKFTEKDATISSACPSTITDIDKNIYKTVQIGSQCWMKENLKVTKNPKGEAITRYCYDNDPKICETDGGLYDWDTAMNGSREEGAQGICPNGWHVPKDSEWKKISEMNLNEKDFKSGVSSNFELIFSGYRIKSSSYDRGLKSYHWSSFEHLSEMCDEPSPDGTSGGCHPVAMMASAWSLESLSSNISQINLFKQFSNSIRCLKDK